MLDFSSNYFELFGLPQTYQVDPTALAERYRELQRVIHPDRFAHASDREKRLSMQGAAHINQAYQTLKDPIGRARYLLSLHGIDIEGQSRTHRDPEFLMEQMELREELESVRHSADPTATLDALIGRIDGQMRALVAKLAVQLETHEVAHLEEARELVLKMQFIHKLRQEAEGLEAQLDEAL
jgi:molecular chaperone HscB